VTEDLFAPEGAGGDYGRQHLVGEGLFDEAVVTEVSFSPAARS